MSFSLEEQSQKEEALLDLLREENFSKLGEEEQNKLMEIAERFQREANVYSNCFPVEEEEFGVGDEGQPLPAPYVNISWTKMDEDYMRRFTVTAITAFLFRMCDEWDVPRDVPVVPVEDYERNPNILNELKPKPLKGHESIPEHMQESYEKNDAKMQERRVVHRFLRHALSFNPDKHVRGSYFPNDRDATRKPVTTKGAVECLVKEEKMRRKKKNTSKYERKRAVRDLQYVQEAAAKSPVPVRGSQIIRYTLGDIEVEQRVPCDDPSEEVKMATPAQWDELRPQLADVTLSRTTREHIPPADFFYRLDIYSKMNYERLQETVRDVYGYCADLDSALFVTKPFRSEKEARAYINTNTARLRTHFSTIQTQAWTLMAPVQANRDKLDMEGPNDTFVNEILLRNKQDNEIGSLMVKKRIKDCKRDQKRRDGKNDKKISEFTLTQIQKFIQENQDSDSDSDEEVEARVTHISKGGLETTQESFKTSYSAQMTSQ